MNRSGDSGCPCSVPFLMGNLLLRWPLSLICAVELVYIWLSVSNIFPLIYLGVFPTAIAFLIRFHIISKAGPIFLSYVAYLIPAFAIIWGFIFLKETINLNTFIGVILVLLGVFISQKNLVNKEPDKSISN